jgi:hypothetical protein
VKRKFFKRSFLVFSFLMVFVGLLLGSSVALAYDHFQALTPGSWVTLSGWMDETPAWSYNASHYEYLNAAKTQAEITDTCYWNGYGDQYNPIFYPLYMYDEYGYDSTCFLDYWGLYVNNVSYVWKDTNWTMDQLSSANNNVVCQQMVRYLGYTYSDHVVGTIAW